MTTTKEQQAAEALDLVERLSRMTDPYNQETSTDDELEAWRSTIREACDIMNVEFVDLAQKFDDNDSNDDDEYDGEGDGDAWSGGFAKNH